MRYLIISLTIILFTISGCDTENEIIPNITDEATELRKPPRPFKGTIVYTLAPVDIPQCACEGIFPGPLSGSGNLTHLGLSSSDTEVCVDVLGPTEFLITEQCVVFTAANGDELWASADPYTVTFDINCFCNSGSGVFNFYDGTGRFAGASGSADFDVVSLLDPITFLPVEVTAVMKGSIQY